MRRLCLYSISSQSNLKGLEQLKPSSFSISCVSLILQHRNDHIVSRAMVALVKQPKFGFSEAQEFLTHMFSGDVSTRVSSAEDADH